MALPMVLTASASSTNKVPNTLTPLCNNSTGSMTSRTVLPSSLVMPRMLSASSKCSNNKCNSSTGGLASPVLSTRASTLSATSPTTCPVANPTRSSVPSTRVFTPLKVSLESSSPTNSSKTSMLLTTSSTPSALSTTPATRSLINGVLNNS